MTFKCDNMWQLIWTLKIVISSYYTIDDFIFYCLRFFSHPAIPSIYSLEFQWNMKYFFYYDYRDTYETFKLVLLSTFQTYISSICV